MNRFATHNRATRNHCSQQTRQTYVDAEDRLSGDFFDAFDAGYRLADQLEGIGRFQVDFRGLRCRQLCGLKNKVSKGGFASVSGKHVPVRGVALVLTQLPCLGGGTNNHEAGNGARHTHRFEEISRAGALRDHLNPGAEYVRRQLVIIAGEGVFGRDGGPVGIQFFSQRLGKAGMDTLANFGLADGDDDLAIGGNFDKGVWFEGGVGAAAEHICHGIRELQRDRQSGGNGPGGQEESAAR
ncbi:hypothetical protein D3C80_1428630 [compost metagenome]